MSRPMFQTPLLERWFGTCVRGTSGVLAGALVAVLWGVAVSSGCDTAAAPDGGKEQPVTAVLDGDERADARLDEQASQPAALGQDLDARIARADQVLHGTVIDIQYAASVDLGPDTMSFPHTFVTARVDTPIKGGQAGDEVTLRFGGGPTDDDRVLMISDIPLLGMGDEVVLLVADNGASACPLVDCAEGLVRISDGRAYDSGGVSLSLDGRDTLRAGLRHAIPEATEFTVGEYRIGLAADGAHPVRKEADAMASDELVSWLLDRVDGVHGGDELAALQSTVSLDPTEPFVIPHPGKERPRWVVPAAPVNGDANAEDRTELAAMLANDNNPVLPRQ